jgi:hypothetical protein
MVSTELGMQIDRSGQLMNAQFPISESLDPDSKVIVSSDEESVKQCSPRISTDDGTQIDFRNKQRLTCDMTLDLSSHVRGAADNDI